jgi:hypothetical protein
MAEKHEGVSQRKTVYFKHPKEQARELLEAGPYPNYCTGNKNGPFATDYGGTLPMIKWCRGCKHHRLLDIGYHYCRLLGDQSKPDTFDPVLKGWPWPDISDGSVAQIGGGQPPDACPYKLDPVGE